MIYSPKDKNLNSYHRGFHQQNSFYTKNKTRIWIYIFLAIFIITSSYFSSKKFQQINNESTVYLEQFSSRSQDQFKIYFSKSKKTSLELAIDGQRYIEKGLTNLGISALEEAIKKDSNIRDINLYLANIYYQNGQLEKALEMAELAINCDPIYAPTYELMTQINTSLGDETSAQICYNKAKDFSR